MYDLPFSIDRELVNLTIHNVSYRAGAQDAPKEMEGKEETAELLPWTGSAWLHIILSPFPVRHPAHQGPDSEENFVTKIVTKINCNEIQFWFYVLTTSFFQFFSYISRYNFRYNFRSSFCYNFFTSESGPSTVDFSL